MEQNFKIIDDILVSLLIGSIVPLLLYFLYTYDMIAKTTFKLLLLVFIIIFIIIPILFKYSYTLQNKMVFLNFVNLPYLPYDKPKLFGLDATRNFYLYNNNIKLGVWHILPENFLNKGELYDSSYDEYLDNGQDVIIYNHGNAGSRGSPHRVELYQVLRKYFHVIAYDYRSYGDSSDVTPSENDIIKDCIFIFKWVLNKTKTNNLYVWGHSLGTSLSIKSLAILQNEGIRSAGLILESPFNNMKEEISEFPLAKLFKNLPWFTFTMVDPLIKNDFKFDTDNYIENVDAPILILHAEDDGVVPYKLGKKLYDDAINSRKSNQGSITFIKFYGKHKYGHKFICRAPHLPNIIQSFIKHSKEEIDEKKLL